MPWIDTPSCYGDSRAKEEPNMKKMYGLFSISGFMITMLCFVFADIEMTKLELTITFLAWIVGEVAVNGIFHLVRWQVQTRRERFRMAHSRSNH